MAWSINDDQRTALAAQTGGNLFSLAFASGKEMTEKEATETSSRLEKEAYTSAQAQSTTTTGSRPIEETTKIYLRKLAELVVEFAGKYSSMAPPTGNGHVDEGVLDLTEDGTRGFLSKERAEELFAPLFENTAKIHTVILSTKSFGIEAAEVACKALKHGYDTIHTANLSDTISGRPEHEALQVLEKLSEALSASRLKEIDLSNNALGEKGLRACRALFSSQAEIDVLSLHNIGCSPDACAALNGLTAEMKLNGLLLSNNMSGDDGAKAIGDMLSRMPGMIQFQMSSSRVGPEGVSALTTGLSCSSQLESFDISDNPATGECIPAIIELLQSQHQLRILNLTDTSLNEDAAIELFKSLILTAPNLQVLCLALNELTFHSVQHLGPALVTKRHLKKLDLSENELEDRGAVVISKAIESIPSLEELNMSSNMLHRTGAVFLAKALKGKKNFKKLCLDENAISAKGINALQEIALQLFGDSELISVADNEEAGDMDENEEINEIDISEADLDGVISRLRAVSLDG